MQAPDAGNDTTSRTRTDPRAAGAANLRGAQPSPRRAACGYCRKRIYLARNGEWYHDRNSTTSCYFGTGSDKRAFPGG